MKLLERLLDKGDIEVIGDIHRYVLSFAGQIRENLTGKFEYPKQKFPLNVPDEAFLSRKYIEGVMSETLKVWEDYVDAGYAFGDGKEKLGNCIGRFAMDTKGLADNLNLFMQTLYRDDSGVKIELKNLEENTRVAPKILNGKNLAKIFNGFHDNSSDNPLIILRNNYAHGEGHRNVIKGYTLPSGFSLRTDVLIDAERFLNQVMKKYMGGTFICLDTILQNDRVNLN